MCATVVAVFFLVVEVFSYFLCDFNHKKHEGSYTTNSLGFRDQEHARESSPGVVRVACVGDSNMYGHGLPVTETIPYMLEQTLNREQPGRYEVMLLAKPGWNTSEKEQASRTALQYKPNFLVYQYDVNDVEWDFNVLPIADRIGVHLSFPPHLMHVMRIIQIDYGMDFFMFQAISQAHDPAAEQWLKTKKRLSAISVLCKSQGVKPIFLLDVNMHITSNHPLVDTLDFIGEEVTALGFHSIPMYKYVDRKNPRDFRLSFADFHNNSRLNHQFVKYIVQAIRFPELMN